MSNSLQLVITLTTFLLGLATFATSYLKPISEKLERVDTRLYSVESDIRVIQHNTEKKPNGNKEK